MLDYNPPINPHLLVAVIKNILIGIFLLIFHSFFNDVFSQQMFGVINSHQTKHELYGRNIDSFIFIATVSGLLLAGAVSGFFQFKYDKGSDSSFKFTLGHICTGLQLVIIGISLVISHNCLSIYFSYIDFFPHFSATLGVLSFLAACAYDLHDAA